MDAAGRADYVSPTQRVQVHLDGAALHVVFTLIWVALTAVFSVCGMRQAGWIGSLDG